VVRVATLAVGVTIGAILVGVAVLLLGPWWVPATSELIPPTPRLSSDGPVVKNGVVAIVACGKKRGFEVVGAAPEARTGTWGSRGRVSATSIIITRRKRPSARRATSVRSRNEVVP